MVVKARCLLHVGHLHIWKGTVLELNQNQVQPLSTLPQAGSNYLPQLMVPISITFHQGSGNCQAVINPHRTPLKLALEADMLLNQFFMGG